MKSKSKANAKVCAKGNIKSLDQILCHKFIRMLRQKIILKLILWRIKVVLNVRRKFIPKPLPKLAPSLIPKLMPKFISKASPMQMLR